MHIAYTFPLSILGMKQAHVPQILYNIFIVCTVVYLYIDFVVVRFVQYIFKRK